LTKRAFVWIISSCIPSHRDLLVSKRNFLVAAYLIDSCIKGAGSHRDKNDYALKKVSLKGDKASQN
jgi:hypothetical protein